MSRSALLKQQGRVEEREQRANEVYASVCEEGRLQEQRRRGKTKQGSSLCLPLWGPDDGTFHWNPLLLKNTIHSPYFQKRCCGELNEWSAVVDEIYYEVKHLQPFQDINNKQPSTAFCLLLRLLTLRLTSHQLDLMLKHTDSPYIRALGFLYLRYVGPPEQIGQWITPYLQDEEEIVVEYISKRTPKPITIGEYVRKLFGQRDYYSTTLPRYPIQIERDLLVVLLQAEQIAERAKTHFQNSYHMQYFRTLGNRIMALYGDEDNPLQWYEAVIDRVITRDESTGHALVYPKFVVTFTEYGNTETVTLGEVDVLDGKWKQQPQQQHNQERHRHGSQDHPSHHHRPNRGYHDALPPPAVGGVDSSLYEEVRRREREGVTAGANRGGFRRGGGGGGGGGGRGPAPQRQTYSTNRQYDDDSSTRPPVQNMRDHQTSSPQSFNHHSHDAKGASAAAANADAPVPPPPKKRTAEELAAVEEKKRRLMAKYG